MDLFYDRRDRSAHQARGSRLLEWLVDLGAKPLSDARPDSEGFLFAGARPIEDYKRLTARYPKLRDRPEQREPLLRLDDVLDALERASVPVRTPRTWKLLSTHH